MYSMDYRSFKQGNWPKLVDTDFLFEPSIKQKQIWNTMNVLCSALLEMAIITKFYRVLIFLVYGTPLNSEEICFFPFPDEFGNLFIS